MSSFTPCDALATKLELAETNQKIDELKEQINNLFGKKLDNPEEIKDVLFEGNLEGTVINYLLEDNLTIEAVSGGSGSDAFFGGEGSDTLTKGLTKVKKTSGGVNGTRKLRFSVKSFQQIINQTGKNGSKFAKTIPLTAAQRQAYVNGLNATLKTTGQRAFVGVGKSLQFGLRGIAISTQFVAGLNYYLHYVAIKKLYPQQQANEDFIIAQQQRDFENGVKISKIIAGQTKEQLEVQIATLTNKIQYYQQNSLSYAQEIGRLNQQIREQQAISADLRLQFEEVKTLLLEERDITEQLIQNYDNYSGELEGEIQQLKERDEDLLDKYDELDRKYDELNSKIDEGDEDLRLTGEAIVRWENYQSTQDPGIVEILEGLGGIDIESATNQELEDKLAEARRRLEAANLILRNYRKEQGEAKVGSSGGGGLPSSARSTMTDTQNKQIEITAKSAGIDPTTIPGYPIEDFQVTRFDNPFSSIIDSLLPDVGTGTNTGTGETVDFQEFSDKNDANFESLAVAIAALTPTLTNINNNTSPDNLRNTVEEGVCNTTSPDGCMTRNVTNPLLNGQNGLGSTITNGLQGLDLVQGQAIFNTVNNTNEFLKKAWGAARMDKVLNILNTALALHNAMMLSRNVGATLGDVASQTFTFFNIKDAEDNPIDVNEIIGDKVETFITTLIGAEKYTAIQQTWTNLNRIMVASQGVIYAVQGIKNATLEGLETIGGWTAKIGNNMMIQGLLEERSFPWMNENVNFRSPFKGIIQKLQTTEEVVSQVSNLVSSGTEAQEGFNELFNNSSELVTASQKLQNDLGSYISDREASEVEKETASASPEITNIDLIKFEPEDS